jgi:hypothetical protein
MKNELLLRNPLQILEQEDKNDLLKSSFGAILAHAGTGKTAILIQLALSAMLQGRNVVHISLDQSIDKVQLWYEELFEEISKEYKAFQINQALEDTQSHRFIMTFKVVGFSVPKLEERLTDLIAQNIFHPNMIIMDGFSFDPSAREFLLELKELALKLGVSVWFTVRTHRHEAPAEDGLPVVFSPVNDLFDLIFQLEPKGAVTHIQPLKGVSSDSPLHNLQLDPSTMLISNKK